MPKNNFIRKSILNLSLVGVSLFSGFISIPLVFAGESIIQGTSVESSSFNNTTVIETTTPIIPDNSSITVNGDTLGASNELQDGLNKDRDGFITDGDNANDLVIAFLKGENTTSNGEAIAAALTRTGADSGLVERLKTTLPNLFAGKSVDINQLKAAIDAYNEIVKKSDGQTLISLNQSAEFKKISEVLKKMKRTVDCSREDQKNDSTCLNI